MKRLKVESRVCPKKEILVSDKDYPKVRKHKWSPTKVNISLTLP